MIYTRSEFDFINFVKEECEKNGVVHSLRNTPFVTFSPGIECSGWFESEGQPELVCSMDRPDWIEILAHEYCHLTQWADKLPLWDKATQSLDRIDRWIGGEEIENINEDFDNARDLELDNEKRTVEIIKRFNLKVNLEDYIKKSNAYVLFYNWLKISRKWSSPDNAPYKNKRVISAMSNKFDMDYETLSPDLEKIFREEKI